MERFFERIVGTKIPDGEVSYNFSSLNRLLQVKIDGFCKPWEKGGTRTLI